MFVLDQSQIIHATTILSVRRNGLLAIGGDGQISQGNTIFKNTVKKVRTLSNGKVLAGFAGVTSDALSIFGYLESYLDHYPELTRACVELVREWRSNMGGAKMEALLIVADDKKTLVLSGSGDIVEPDDGIVAVGSGGLYALSAARSLIKHTNLTAAQIVHESLTIASELCVFTNANFTILTKEIGVNHE